MSSSYPIVGPESLMDGKSHGTCEAAVMTDLRLMCSICARFILINYLDMAAIMQPQIGFVASIVTMQNILDIGS
jgi:hypothetical protein